MVVDRLVRIEKVTVTWIFPTARRLFFQTSDFECPLHSNTPTHFRGNVSHVLMLLHFRNSDGLVKSDGEQHAGGQWCSG